MDSIIPHIELALNETVTQCVNVYGGDVNRCLSLITLKSRYFLKLNDAAIYPGMFEREAEGLVALSEHSNLMVPEAIKQGVFSGMQWLLLQWFDKEPATENDSRQFGISLAEMHQQKQPFFGWHADNFIGSLQQLNARYDSWPAFYAQCRILPLVHKLFDNNDFTTQDLRRVEAFCKKLEYTMPSEPPALLHGDLWSGNYMMTAKGAAIFDPAVYFGHREMDIGMSKLFGGFSEAFYKGYQETYPMENGWQERLPVTQLYPLMVHALLFGGHYIVTCRELLKKLE